MKILQEMAKITISGFLIKVKIKIRVFLNFISEGGAKFKATAQKIHFDGQEANRRELQSKKDGTRQRIKYEEVATCSYFCFVRFNITFL